MAATGSKSCKTACRAGDFNPTLHGRQMYALLSRAKIVLNGAVDSALEDRGNIRCFEAMGCGALLLTDPGRYPEGMEDGRTMRVYDCAEDAVRILRECLRNTNNTKKIAAAGLAIMKERYSKREQWRKFQGAGELIPRQRNTMGPSSLARCLTKREK